ncbi:uncharacterized protein LOC113866549 [Abrus precatorius]|uniref:Uncharacterized protein LOC113866549 n=1 Tax=Abrus precatorius TaxID=3816 RepID=A0A8B8LP41_ABRPR|nr:uncharacterized protein LOC113866549 [Abrus precatorius]
MAIVFTLHLAMKFSSDRDRIITVHADQKLARECYFASMRLKPFPGPSRDVNIVSEVELDVELDPRIDEGFWVEPSEDKKPFQLGKKSKQTTYLRTGLSLNKQQALQKIRMYPPDEGKTAFITDTSASLGDHITHLIKVFIEAQRYGMRFDLEKYMFGIAKGKFLGFMLSERGIQANPDKCQAVVDMRSPDNTKEVQRLTGRIAALSRFLPRIAEKPDLSRIY